MIKKAYIYIPRNVNDIAGEREEREMKKGKALPVRPTGTGRLRNFTDKK